MPVVCELDTDQTDLAVSALLELRPQLQTAEVTLERVAVQRATGYRLVASFREGESQAAGVAGFRVAESLAWGRHVYVDDLVTRASRRGEGHAHALFAWLEAEARRLGCGQLHLDSGVIPERADAHRFYFRHGLRISAFHFQESLD